MVATHKRRTNWQPHTDLPELAKKNLQKLDPFSRTHSKKDKIARKCETAVLYVKWERKLVLITNLSYQMPCSCD